MYDLEALDRALAESIYAGKIFFAEETTSTNNDALAAARQGAAHGSVFLANAQSAGRGRSNHGWHSAPGEGLYVSLVLRPAAPPARWLLLPFCAGLAAASAIHSFSGLKADLRWPNDVLLGTKKICGILVEVGTDCADRRFAVVGIGINANQRIFPEEMASFVTSIALETGRSIHRQALLIGLLKSLQRETAALASEAAARQILAKVEDSSTWVRGRRVDVHGPQACTGLTAGLDEHGFLRVETAEGTVTVQTGGIRAAEIDSTCC